MTAVVHRLPEDRIPCVVAVELRGEFSVHFEFDDGVSKQVDLRPLLRGAVFEPLLGPEQFAKVHVDPEAGTIVWPHDVDLAPETLYLLPSERGSAA